MLTLLILRNRPTTSAGLKLDDLIIETPEMLKALDRVPREQQVERERRIKRAFDLSAKRKTLPGEYAPSNVFDSYLVDAIAKVEAEEEERKILNGY